MNDSNDHRGVTAIVPPGTGRDLAPSVRSPYGAGGLSTETQSYDREPEDADEINLMDYWRTLIKRRWTIISALFIVVVVTLVSTLLATPMYRASTTLQIEKETIKVVDVGSVEPGQQWDNGEFYQTQYELLKSRALAKRVANSLGLAEASMIERTSRPSPLAKLIETLRSPFTGSIKPSETEIDPGPEAKREALVGVVAGGLKVEPVRNSRLVQVHFSSPDPRFSAQVANQIADGFIAMNLERRIDASSYAKTYLQEGLEQLKIKLEDSERRLVEFAQKEGIVDIANKESLVSEQMSQINTSFTGAQNDRIKAESRYRQLKIVGGEGLPEVLESGVIGKLKETLASLQTDYQNKLSVFKPKYPVMQQLRQQIDEVKRQIDQEIGNIKRGIITEYEAAASKEKMLQASVGELKAGVLDLQGRSIQYNTLKREVDTTRQLYDGLLQRYKEIGVAGGVGTNNISVVDRAEVPGGAYSPNLSRNLALATLLGLMLGGLLAFLFEHLDDTVKSPEDVERQLGLSVLGVIPMIRKGAAYDQLKDVRSAFSEAYRSTRTALQFSTDIGMPRVLFVTSASPGEGKSTTALALAHHVAQLKKRVLLIDGDLRNPSLHKVLELKNTLGLSNCLVGATAVPLALQKGDLPNIYCITSGPLPPSPTELLAGSRMQELLKFGLEHFDQIIIDGPPVMGIADAPVLGNIADGTLLVMEAGGTRVGLGRNIIKRLAMSKTRLLGVLITKFDAREAGYYGTGYYYGDSSYTYGNKAAAKSLKRA